MNAIRPLIRQIFLAQFLKAWQKWSYHEKPHSFWLREYSALESEFPDAVPPLMWAQRVWLLNEEGMSEKNPLDWRRFELLQRDFGASLWRGSVNEIGFGCFAPTAQPNHFYYDEIWGARWGTGGIYHFNEQGRIIGSPVVWRS